MASVDEILKEDVGDPAVQRECWSYWQKMCQKFGMNAENPDMIGMVRSGLSNDEIRRRCNVGPGIVQLCRRHGLPDSHADAMLHIIDGVHNYVRANPGRFRVDRQ